MIRAMIFDLDGTLVQTEKLKALSYAKAVGDLCPEEILEADVIEAFVQVRLRYYEELLADPNVLRNNQWSHNMALLQEARNANCQIGLATMSHCAQVQRVLNILDLENAFDFVATRDDVENGKPDPEVYKLVAAELAVPVGECLVIEDSPSGVKAALAAGMWGIAVTTPFTREALHKNRLLDERWIVDDTSTLPRVLSHLVEEHNRSTHKSKSSN